MAPAAGRYAVEISGPVPCRGRRSRLALAPAAAPVSLTEVELPADLAWSAPGTVVVEDRVDGARRTVRLTSRRGQAQTVEVRRKVDGGDAEKLLAQSVVLTLRPAGPDGPRRHDVVLYEVSRGGLGSFTVDLPAGLTVETVGTDEGEVVPAVESRRLTVQRRQQLAGCGYLVLTSTPRAAGAGAAPRSGGARGRPYGRATWPWPPRWRRTSSRSRGRLVADRPRRPAAGPARALGGIDLAAAWRLAGPGLRAADGRLAPAGRAEPAGGGEPAGDDDPDHPRRHPAAPRPDHPAAGGDRHRPRPHPAGRAPPSGRPRWTSVPVRPLERGGGRISVPLGFDAGRDAVVEVVSVQEKAIPKGRSELALDAPAGGRAGAGAPLAAAAAGRRPLPLPLGRPAAGAAERRPADPRRQCGRERDGHGEDSDRPGPLGGPRVHARRAHRPDQRRRQRVGPAGAVCGSGPRSCGAGSTDAGRPLAGRRREPAPRGAPPVFLVANAEGLSSSPDLPSGDYQVEASSKGSPGDRPLPRQGEGRPVRSTCG